MLYASDNKSIMVYGKLETLKRKAMNKNKFASNVIGEKLMNDEYESNEDSCE